MYSLYKGQLSAVRLYGDMCKCVYLIQDLRVPISLCVSLNIALVE